MAVASSPRRRPSSASPAIVLMTTSSFGTSRGSVAHFRCCCRRRGSSMFVSSVFVVVVVGGVFDCHFAIRTIDITLSWTAISRRIIDEAPIRYPLDGRVVVTIFLVLNKSYNYSSFLFFLEFDEHDRPHQRFEKQSKSWSQ